MIYDLINRAELPTVRIEIPKRLDDETTQILSAVVESILTTIKSAPTIDAAPVIRCNTCKYYEQDTGFCNYHGGGMHWDGFCSCGAKMDREE